MAAPARDHDRRHRRHRGPRPIRRITRTRRASGRKSHLASSSATRALTTITTGTITLQEIANRDRIRQADTIKAVAKILHVLWSPQEGPTVGYWDPTQAWSHACTMLGVDVAQVEIREDLPEIARTDIESDYEGDDDTPRVVDVHFEDIDDPDKP
jgi:hypothetical protein